MNYRRAVFLVVYTKNKSKIEYLLLKRKLHWRGWEFPKGGIEKGEKKEKAVIRELKEETGLKKIKIKRFNFSGKYKYNKEFSSRPRIIGQTFSLYAVEVKKARVRISKKEHSGHKWVDFKTALKKLKWPNQRKSLKLVNSWLNNGV